MGHRHRQLTPIAGVALWLLVAVVLRRELEASMLGHALVQLPLLALSGAWCVRRRGAASPHALALSALLVAIFTSAIWMLPRMLDASLADPRIELAKLVTIPLLVGCPISWSWARLGGLTRAFVWANGISMLVTLGWLYKAAPLRVCNAYLLDEQQLVGSAFFALATIIVLGWLPVVFLGNASAPRTQP